MEFFPCCDLGYPARPASRYPTGPSGDRFIGDPCLNVNKVSNKAWFKTIANDSKRENL